MKVHVLTMILTETKAGTMGGMTRSYYIICKTERQKGHRMMNNKGYNTDK